MLHSLILAKQVPINPDFFEFVYFSGDIYSLLIRMTINIVALTIIIRYLYYPKTQRKDYLFTYYLIGFITFFLCLAMTKIDIDTGMGLGLFAIFGIIRYRTDAIEIKEMTYLFVVIGISVVNAIAANPVTLTEIGIINTAVIGLIFLLEYVFLLKHETRKTITYERIDLIVPEKKEEMKSDLEKRTGIKINRVEVGKINFLNDTAQVLIYYYGSDQAVSDYNSESTSN